MKHENKKRYLNDKDRDGILKLLVCGLSTDEIASICHCSKSTVSYIRQAHTACLNQDWSTLQKLSTDVRSTVTWAMKVTNVDKTFEELFKEEPKPEETVTGPTVDDAPNPVDPRNLYEMYEVLTDIRSLLTEIRDILK